METLFDELKRYVGFGADDEGALRALHPVASPHFVTIADAFYRRILEHDTARTVLEGGESQVGRLKTTLVAWMDRLLSGPWDEEYFEVRSRIGRVHVRIGLPQHYMLGAMNVIRGEMGALIDARALPAAQQPTRAAVGKILDLELAIMLHTYREDLLAQKEKMERLSTFGQLVGSLGHELRNPLGVMESSLFLLKGYVGADERAQKHANRIGEQLSVANGIITSLLDMIRDRPIARESVPARALLEAARNGIEAPPGVTLHLEGWEEAPPMDVDQGQWRQVLVNLIENALHAVGERGEIWLRARAIEGGVAIDVEDSGAGVDAAIRSRLFEPLVTTKAKGIGLGLAFVKRIVERHGGAVTYSPRPGGGSRFSVSVGRRNGHA